MTNQSKPESNDVVDTSPVAAPDLGALQPNAVETILKEKVESAVVANLPKHLAELLSALTTGNVEYAEQTLERMGKVAAARAVSDTETLLEKLERGTVSERRTLDDVQRDAVAKVQRQRNLSASRVLAAAEYDDAENGADTTSPRYSKLQERRLADIAQERSRARHDALLKRTPAGTGPCEAAYILFKGPELDYLLELGGLYPDNGTGGDFARTERYKRDRKTCVRDFKRCGALRQSGSANLGSYASSYLYNGTFVPAEVSAAIVADSEILNDGSVMDPLTGDEMIALQWGSKS